MKEQQLSRTIILNGEFKANKGRCQNISKILNSIGSLFFGGSMQKEEKVYVKLKSLTHSIQNIYASFLSLSRLLVSLHTFKILFCLVFDLLSDVVQCYILQLLLCLHLYSLLFHCSVWFPLTICFVTVNGNAFWRKIDGAKSQLVSISFLMYLALQSYFQLTTLLYNDNAAGSTAGLGLELMDLSTVIPCL